MYISIVQYIHDQLDALKQCYQSLQSLYTLDLFLSYLAIAYTFSPFYNPIIRNVYHAFAAPCVAIVVILLFDDMIGGILVVGITGGAFLIYEFDTYYRRCQRHWLILPAIALFIGALTCKSYSDTYPQTIDATKYTLYHSFWHILTAVASSVLYLSIEKCDDTIAYKPISKNSSRKVNSVV